MENVAADKLYTPIHSNYVDDYFIMSLVKKEKVRNGKYNKKYAHFYGSVPDSRKEHEKLLWDIRGYVSQLAEAKIGFGDFFTESEVN